MGNDAEHVQQRTGGESVSSIHAPGRVRGVALRSAGEADRLDLRARPLDVRPRQDREPEPRGDERAHARGADVLEVDG